jgi:aspartyl-tRNA(Asn)/glutamyl-tRNA(Gln) amidotransferase subunit C
MSVSSEEIRRVAQLARIHVSDADVERFTPQLSKIVDYVDRLQAIDVQGLKESAVFSDMLPPDRDLPRSDETEHEQIIQDFPDRLGDLLRVPSVFPRRSITS